MRPCIVSSWLAPAVLLAASAAVPRADDGGAAIAATAATAAAAAPRPTAEPPPLGAWRLDPSRGRYVAPLGEGTAILTLDPRLQTHLERTLRSFAVPWGVTVLIEPATGRVLAMAEHSQAEPGRRGLALAALGPAASIFKIVTAAALMEQGVRPDDQVCYHGGYRRLQPALLADDPRRDHACATLEQAFGQSTNVVFAKLADRGLDAAALGAVAGRFLFNAPIPFARPVEVSGATVGGSAFELANAAAGFGPVRLSPLHGALLAAIVANGGVFVPPVLVEEAEGVAAPAPPAPSRVVDEAVATALADMMRRTVTEGTARRAFYAAGGPLRGVAVAGKTGSLSDQNPFRDYSWFVGYAPADHPAVAVATLIVNGPIWRTHAPAVAKDALETYFSSRVAAVSHPEALRTAKAPPP